MQFDRAEPLIPAAPPVCAACHQVLSGHYYSVGPQRLCVDCGGRIKGASSFDGNRFLMASLCGLGAVMVGGGVNWFLASMSNSFGIVAIFAGILVGYAVRWGSGGRGGRPYQVLATLLTYPATAAMFIPLLQKEGGAWTIGRVLQPLWILLLAPMAGLQGLFLWLILGIGMSQAWRMNRSVAVAIQGPFTLGSPMPPDGKGGV